jgi:hypothetical protein
MWLCVYLCILCAVLWTEGTSGAWNTSVVQMCLIPPTPLGNVTADIVGHERNSENHQRTSVSLTSTEFFEVFTPPEWKSLKLDTSLLFGGSKSKHAFVVRSRSKLCTTKLVPEFCQVGRLRAPPAQTAANGTSRLSSDLHSHRRVVNGAALYRKWSNMALNVAEQLVFTLLDRRVYRLMFIGALDDILNRQAFDFLVCDLLRTSARLALVPELRSRSRLRTTLAHDNVVIVSFVVEWPESALHGELFQVMFLRNREPFQHYTHVPGMLCPTPKAFSRESFSYMYKRLDSVDTWWPGRQSPSYSGSLTFNLTVAHSRGGVHNTTNSKELIVFNTVGWSAAQKRAVADCPGLIESTHILRPRVAALIKFAKDYPNKYAIFREAVHFSAHENSSDACQSGSPGHTGVLDILHGLEPRSWYRYIGYLRLQSFSAGMPVLQLVGGTDALTGAVDTPSGRSAGVQAQVQVQGLLYSPFVLGIFWYGIGHELAALMQRRLRPGPWMDGW